MSNIIRKGRNNNQITGETSEIEVLHGIDFNLSKTADLTWVTFNLKLLQHLNDITNGDTLAFRQLYEESQLEDFHWRWLNKAMSYNTNEYEWFYYIAENEIQGVCVIYHPKQSKIDDENVFYIEFVATAPWNRLNRMCDIKFKGIGSALLRESLIYSINILGYRPGFSLHSLPQATTYYEKIGMQNFGPDPGYHGLIYLEMEQRSSEVFANGR